MKRFLSFAIAFMLLVTGILPGCAVLSSGTDYCKRFIDYIADGEFEKAYDMIDVATKRDEPESTAKVTPMAIPTDTVEAHEDAVDQSPDDDQVIDGKVVETPEPTATPTPSPTP